MRLSIRSAIAVAGLAALSMFATTQVVDSAEASQSSEPVLRVGDYAMGADETLTATVELDPGSFSAAGLTGSVEFDASLLDAVECSVTGATGACRVGDGEVSFAVINPTGWESEIETLEIDFEAVADDVTVELVAVLEDLVDVQINPISANVENGSIEIGIAGIGSITGTVVDEDGNGVWNAHVCFVHSSTGKEICANTNGFGSYRLDDLAVGEYDMSVLAGDLSAALNGLSISADTVASVEDAVLSAPAASEGKADNVGLSGSISGRVFAGDWLIAAAEVCASQPLFGIHECAISGGDGTYRIDGLVAGNYKLTVTDLINRFDDGAAVRVSLGIDQSRSVDVKLGAR